MYGGFKMYVTVSMGYLVLSSPSSLLL